MARYLALTKTTTPAFALTNVSKDIGSLAPPSGHVKQMRLGRTLSHSANVSKHSFLEARFYETVLKHAS